MISLRKQIIHQRSVYMTKKSKFSVKYEQEKNENCLSSFGGIPIFLEFLKGIGFDRIVSAIGFSVMLVIM